MASPTKTCMGYLTSWPSLGAYACLGVGSTAVGMYLTRESFKIDTLFRLCCPLPLSGPLQGSWNYTIGPCSIVNITSQALSSLCDAGGSMLQDQSIYYKAGYTLIATGLGTLSILTVAACVKGCKKNSSEPSPESNSEQTPLLA